MLYILQKVDGTTYYLFNNKEYKIGRKDCEIVIADDSSVSRKHAIIKIANDQPVLIDCNSKFGTTINSVKLTSDVENILHEDDSILFGVFQSQFSFKMMHIEVTGSALDDVNKNKLKRYIKLLGGKLVNDWTSECVYLTVEQIILSVKCLHALIDGKSMVLLKFWEQFIENVRNKKPPPDPTDYLPPLGENLLNNIDLEQRERRKTLFANKLFVFSTENEKSKMNGLVVKSGGECISWEKQPFALKDVHNSKKEYVIVQNRLKKFEGLEEIKETISKQGKRIIPVQEIAFAIAICSVEKDCNPNFNKVNTVFKTKNPQISDTIIAPETQSQYFSATENLNDSKSSIVIPETVEPDLDVPLFKQTNVTNKSNKASTSKRLNDCNETTSNEGKVPKKARLEILDVNKSVIEETQPSLLSSTTTTTAVSKMPFISTNKRKAKDPPVETANKKEKISSVKLEKNTSNPFAVKSNSLTTIKIASDNPFAFKKPTSEAKKRGIEEELPFTSSTQKNTTQCPDKTSNILANISQNPFTSKQIGQTTITQSSVQSQVAGNAREKTRLKTVGNKNKEYLSSTCITTNNNQSILHNLDLSKIGHVSYTDTWLSKTQLYNKTKEDSLEVSQNIDPMMDKFCKSFKDKIIIKKMEKIIKKVFINARDNNDISSQGKNFKKFRKVQPLKPQTVIITKENMTSRKE